MKKIVLALICAASMNAGAINPVNHGQYILVPADPSAPGLFLAENAEGSPVTTDDYSSAAAWQWDWVSGTATVAGHYTLKNLSSGRYLYTVDPNGAVTLSDSEIGIKRQAANIVADASMFTDGSTWLSTSTATTVIPLAEPSASSEFLLLSYSPDASAAEMIAAAREQRTLIAAKADANASLEPVFRASQSGTNGLKILYSNIAACTTVEQLEQTITDMRRVGIRMFESDLEVGAVWRQLSTGLWVTFANGEYRGTTAPGAAGIWYAEFTDNGDTVLDNRRFYLRSNASRRYLVAPDETEAPVGNSTGKQGATLWKLLASADGIAITPDFDDSDRTPRLLTLNTEDLLVVSARPAAEGASYVGSLPTFGQGINSITPTGPENAVNTIEITVQSGATPLPDGEISLTLRRADTAGSVKSTFLRSFSPTALSSPVEKTITVDYYNSQGQHITGEARVDVYTLPLDSTYTAPGEYMARMSFASFELNGAFSEETGGFTTIDENSLWALDVKPDNGLTMPILEKITVNGPNGVYANPNAAEMTLLTIKFDPAGDGATEEILTATETDFREGGKYDSYDLDADNPDWFTIPCGYTTPGRYTLIIPRGFFVDNGNAENAELIQTWTIDPEGGLTTPHASTPGSNSAIFDLTGRRLPAAPTAAPYVRNRRIHLPRN